MLTLPEYKKLLGKYLDGLSEEEIQAWYETHTLLAELVMKFWLEKRIKFEE